MKILISNESYNAHYFERLGLARAFSYSGHQAILWDIRAKSAFDMFDEFQPDIFIGQAYNLDRATIKCILQRPALRVILKAGDFGPFYDDWTPEKHQEFPILMANKQEKERVQTLIDNNLLDFLFIHYHPDYIEQTHGHWKVPVISLMNASDIFDYTRGKHHTEFASDICFIGGRWGYKSKTLDKWILPLCNPKKKLDIKIFGNSNWGISQYYGLAPTEIVRHLFSSAVICPNVSEPHSQEFGFDIIERPFKLMSNRAFVISDYVEGLRKLYSEDELVMTKSPQEFAEKVDFFLNNPEKRHAYIQPAYEKTIKYHTYFDRANTILKQLGLPTQSVEDGKMKAIKELQL